MPNIHRSVDADDKTSDVTVKVIGNAVAAFLHHRTEARMPPIEKATYALMNTYQMGKSIVFFDAGN